MTSLGGETGIRREFMGGKPSIWAGSWPASCTASRHASCPAPLALMRPDRIVTWRATTTNGAFDALSRVTGRSHAPAD
jgi:hypothetical protein